MIVEPAFCSIVTYVHGIGKKMFVIRSAEVFLPDF